MSAFMNSLRKRWAGNNRPSRTQQRVQRNLGKIRVPMPDGASMLFRKPELEVLDAYFESRQYDHLANWRECEDNKGNHVSIYDRKPRVIYNLPKVLTKKVGAKLVGDDVFPKFNVEEDPDTEEYLRFIIKASKLKSRIIQPVNKMLNAGSTFVRFYIENGAFVVENYDAKHVYPELSPSGDLQSARIRYAFESEELDSQGRKKMKWFQLDLGATTDILYDNPDFDPEKEPVFQAIETVPHEMGFVQGEWMRTAEVMNEVDGYSLMSDILDFCDELNYNLSQSSTAVAYNQDPQLTFSEVDQEDMEKLLRSSSKSWNLGRGKGEFLESSLTGVEVAGELRNLMRNNVVDVTRVLLMDPEKVVTHAQSGRAMEILHGPMVDMVKEIRPILGESMKRLTLKMGMANLIVGQRGLPAPVNVPPGYRPKSLDVDVSWPPVFAMTLEDLQKKVGIVNQATSSFIISEETATKWIAKDFGVEDIEEERSRIAAQPVRNPFGAF